MLSHGGVPVRQNQGRDFSFSRFVNGRIPLPVDDVVFWIRGSNRAGKTEQFSVQLKISRRLIREKFVAGPEHCFVQDAQIFGGSMTVAGILLRGGPVAGPFEPPVK